LTEISDLVVRATKAPLRRERLDAYGRLVERFRDMACGYAWSLLGDFHLAEDAAQEAFVVAFERLEQLEKPEAFAGWLRQIVWSACRRATRRRTVRTLDLQAAGDVPSSQPAPVEHLEREETREQVTRILAALPASQREVTTLFYIAGHSQRDIAEFLGIPVATVKNRLNASRTQLKERMVHMVKDTLHGNAPGEEFNKRVVEELLAWPRPLEVATHPLRRVYDALRQALPGYDVVDGDEIVDRAGIANPWTLQFAIPTEKDRMLRTELTVTAFAAIAGRKPPVRLFTAGRAFRNAAEDRKHARVFHEFNLVCIESGAGEEEMKQLLQRLIPAVFGPAALRYEAQTLPALAPCMSVEAELQQGWRGVCGCGVFKPEFLKKAGYDSSTVGGYVVAMELENLVMLKGEIDDVHELWRAPHLP
jgi:RNA polymerase sigma factor (sigma-70 family)